MSSKKEAIEQARKDFGERYLKPLIIITVSAASKRGYATDLDEIHFLLSKYFKNAGENPPRKEDVYKEIERLRKENMLK
jgi:hypothetical protein